MHRLLGSGINQNPIRFYVRIPITCPAMLERMILVLRGQRVSREQQLNQPLQFFEVFTAFLKPFHVALELRRVRRRSHQIPSLRKRSAEFLARRTSRPLADLRMVCRVNLLGFRSKGSSFSLATRVSTMRIASDTVSPMPPRTSAA